MSDECRNTQAFKPTLKVVRPGREFEIQVAAVPTLATGSAQVPVTIRTSLTNLPVVSFTVMAMVQPVLTVMPGEVVLPAGPLAGQTLFTVSVRNTRPEPVTVSDPALSVSNATVNMMPVQPGRFYNLALCFSAGFQLKPGELAQLAFKTSNPRTPLMQVPIRMPPSAPSAGIRR